MREQQQSLNGSGYGHGICALMLAAAAAGGVFGCGSNTQQIVLTANDPNPTGSPPALAMDAWAAQIAQQSGGRLKVTVSHDATLLSMDKWFTGVQTGMADFGMYRPSAMVSCLTTS